MDIQRVTTVFERVRRVPIADLDTVLRDECAGDHGLERELRQLLLQLVSAPVEGDESSSADARSPMGAVAERALESASTDVPTTPYELIEERAGDCVGEYVLERLVGQGTVGSVWLARNPALPGQLVAVKIVRPGMDSRGVVARFALEQRVLTRLNHPGIAKVFGAGMTSFGRPYFAMEFIDGPPITTFCDECALTPTRRVDLFARVCDAVQHAHRRGIIHRDLKPSNVLVQVVDGAPVAKVIDFGIAKAMDELGEASITSTRGSPLGTPAYMSPEQARGEPVDTRSDVYALGAVLHELLWGFAPHAPREGQAEAGVAAVLERVRRGSVPSPAAALARLDSAEIGRAAEARRTSPEQFVRLARGELAWIVMRALEAEPERRYASPSDLARDLEAWVHGRAVVAAPPSRWYRFRVFARGHKAGLAGTALVVVGLAVAGLVGGSAWRRAEQARRHAQRREGLSETLRGVIKEFLAPAPVLYERVAASAQDIFSDSGPARRAQIIDASRDAVRASLEARVNAVIDRVYSGDAFATTLLCTEGSKAAEAMSGYDVALRFAERACEAGARVPDHPPSLLNAQTQRARILQRLGDFEGAFAEYQRLRGEYERVRLTSLQDFNNLLLLRATCLTELNRYDEAEAAYQELRDIQGKHDKRDVGAMTITLRRLQGRTDDAVSQGLEAWRASIAQNQPPELRLAAAGRYANTLERATCLDDASQVLEPSLVEAVPALGYSHPITGMLTHTLARVRIAQGRGAEAIPLIERLDRNRRTIAPCHVIAIATSVDLGEQYAAVGNADAARSVLEDAIVRAEVYHRQAFIDRARKTLEALPPPAGGEGMSPRVPGM